MSFNPRPCHFCGGTSFHVLPDVLIEPHKSALGGIATQKISGAWWRVTIVACTQCKRTDLFSPTIDKLATVIPGSYIATSTG